VNLVLILGIGIGGFIGLGSILKAAALTRHWRRNRRFLRFRFHEPVDVVISTDKRLDTPLTETGRTYPRFVASLGSLEAASDFSRLIGQVKSRKPIRIQMSEKLTSELRGDLVLLGGPVLNDVSDLFLRRLNEVYDDINVVFEDDKAEQARISVGSFSDSYDCTMQRRHPDFPTDDFALVVAWRNPFAHAKRRAILCAGFTYHGTAAATHYLINEVIPRGGPLGCECRWWQGLRRTWPCFVLALRVQFSADKPVLVEERAVAPLPELAPVKLGDLSVVPVLQLPAGAAQFAEDSSRSRT
jgi:hypothetical protein